MRVVTGVLYTFTPGSRMSGFLIFAWLGFLGLVMYWRAFRMAVPVGDARRYAMLIFLLPSLVYWPSAIGKEAWMTFALGFCALGVARIFTNHIVSGVLLLALGFMMSGWVRPHLGLAVFAGLLIGVLVRKRRSRNPIVPIVAVGLLLYVGLALVAQNQQYFGVENLTQEAIRNQLDNTERRTGEAGSSFSPVRVNNPLDFPLAFVTIFYRPTPLEAHNAQGMLTAAEGMILAGLTVLSWRRVAAMTLYARRYPFIPYAIGFIVLFVIAFSAFSNFGILARQRTQAIPLYLVLLALPQRGRVPKHTEAEADAVTVSVGRPARAT
jgi:xanthosine utilization system XapX-like protein